MNNKYFKADFTFTKKGVLSYISHLDLMRLLMRAARRASLPLYLSEGFSPHPKLSLKRALKLGVESDCEEGEILLTRKINSGLFRRGLNRQLPEGVKIKDVNISS
jgi:radical SAM-linked protein